jgi:hypothetical protein
MNNTETINMKQLVKKNTATFSHYRNQHVFYNIGYEGRTFQFPICVDATDESYDIGNATLNGTEKAMTLMRYMRKAIANNTFVNIS